MRTLYFVLLLFPLIANGQLITRIQLIPLSNYVDAVQASVLFSSNYLYSQITVGGITAAQATNIAQAVSTITSNGLASIIVANDTTTSNGLTGFVMVTSNNLASLLVANDTFTSNALRTAYLASDITTSNGAVSFTMTASNNLFSTETTRNAAVSNSLVTLLVGGDTTTSNALRSDITNLQGGTNGLDTRLTVVSNAFRTDIGNLQGATNGLGTSLTTASNALRTDISNLQGGTNGLRTDVLNLQGGTNGLDTGVNGLLSRSITNGDTRASSVINLSASNFVATNISVRAGSSASNAFVGGTIWSTVTAVANPTSNGTLAATITIPIAAHTMTNNGDRVVARFIGNFPTAQANTNEFALVINNGGPNVSLMDTGLQTASNCTYIVEIHITRSGVSSHIVDSHVVWGPGGGVPFATTNTVVVTTTTTNGLGLNLVLQSTARRQGSHTNLIARAWFDPAPR